ncbi:hypothetical protein SAY86_000142 [Trapa natans]|uniref:B3 domain-containing transcription repressor VAL2-like n=1 Tax=Trapa natans TaxID=22666 RepID=A0AAN7MAD3_TRANT|nr:hypothetical protein SAY86_000142 [Trapa natans]
MGSKTCMNALCGESSSVEWRKGWTLRSGESADLCDKCGSAYEQSIFCDIFHSKDSGWRDCVSCGKRLHCGCIASRFLLELLDNGGVNCTSCARSSGICSMTSDEKPTDFSILNAGPLGLWSDPGGKHCEGGGFEKMILQTGSSTEKLDFRHPFLSQQDNPNGLVAQMKQEDAVPSSGEIGNSHFRFSHQASNGEANNVDDPLAHPTLSMSLSSPSGNMNPLSRVAIDERSQSRQLSLSQQGFRSQHLLPKPPKSATPSSLETNRGIVTQIRVARPPVEGRGRNQLLPRYWPRITDEELQQISGDSNSTIVPLFEKVLSASDAGRIGRLVLPKACAEAYFPPISQPEGLPLRIQDVKGKEWVFQFRFWPNNNSRMYVLEGVTPCIQSMQLQAGDTVTFSRMDPEGKLIMGFRKASASVAIQGTQISAMTNGVHSAEPFYCGNSENLSIISGYSSLLQSLKGNVDPHISALSKHFTSTSSDTNWQNSEKHEEHGQEPFIPPLLLEPDRKRAKNIGMNSKRLLIDSQEALELKLTWEEAQDLLRPPLSSNPSVVVIDDHTFEEYDEPPIFGKRSIFVARATGMQEQWAQCDNCAKWRKFPVDILLPSRWMCSDNSSNESRFSCSIPEELSPRELENMLKLNKESNRQRLAATSFKLVPDNEFSGLDTLANAAFLGDIPGGAGTTPSVAATTKHPRHRPGCSCIVCIQPPSGKGKHKPNCNCNVCMTVKRRFKTLMMRKKKRQSEREAEITQQKNRKIWGPKDSAEADSSSRNLSFLDSSEPQSPTTDYPPDNSFDIGKGQILDLNSQPIRDEDPSVRWSQVSMTNLLKVASQPLESYLKQNGLTSLVSEQQESGPEQVQNLAPVESEGHAEEDHDRDPCNDSEVLEKLDEQDEDVREEPSGRDQSQADT